jgi:hypothetical protein
MKPKQRFNYNNNNNDNAAVMILSESARSSYVNTDEVSFKDYKSKVNSLASDSPRENNQKKAKVSVL